MLELGSAFNGIFTRDEFNVRLTTGPIFRGGSGNCFEIFSRSVSKRIKVLLLSNHCRIVKNHPLVDLLFFLLQFIESSS